MIEIEIPRDVREYESKLFGPFTTRQSICLIIGGGLAFLGYKIFGNIDWFPSDMQLFASGLLAIPALLFGWFKPFGMKLELFLKTAFKTNVLAKTNRLYKVENDYFVQTKPLTKKELEAKRKTILRSTTYVEYK